jgi:hypothetical protein
MNDQGVAFISPWFGVNQVTEEILEYPGVRWRVPIWTAMFWGIDYACAAAAVFWATRQSFDRCLGRVEGHYPLGRPAPPSSCAGTEQEGG